MRARKQPAIGAAPAPPASPPSVLAFVAHVPSLVRPAAAREKRYTIREFTFEATKAADEEAKRYMEEKEHDRLKTLLTNWRAINFAEAYIMMLHLKAIRIFVESVLRYGARRSPAHAVP